MGYFRQFNLSEIVNDFFFVLECKSAISKAETEIKQAQIKYVH